MDTYEKKYNEALERARQIKDGKDEWRYSDLAEIIPALTYIFPQLRESEDEKLRKLVIDRIRTATEMTEGLRELLLDYLEKQKEPENTSASTIIPSCWEVEQKEQKPKNILTDKDTIQTAYCKGQTDVIEDPEAYGLCKKPEWSEEDENYLGVIVRLVEQVSGWPERAITEYTNWLKSLRPQPKVELSEDVKKTLDEVSHILVGLNYKQIAKDYKQAVEKLIYARPSWKPSEEQMEALNKARRFIPYNCDILESLYEQLKKL